ncbi:hypothetical protein [Lyngbya sp. CCY1209]|jgi:hypothetical protein|uniref:hypothetical protein n=1 Tax=Lyngbya sp. CCY1209 TaxID=2886103 RepID=UPI002D20BC7D|nr:hypothetical protein [Lyngbya sp. CCY1209]MEB3885676.1 hypothetical protein [Lyngbya sp. CCY1209]
MTATSNASTPSLGIKLASAVGLVAFAGFYFSSWQRSLFDHYAQQQEQETETLVAEAVTPDRPSTAEMVEAMTVATPATPAEITDPSAIADLNARLYEQIDQNWRQYPTFTENLVYRITVNKMGAIAEYATVNPAAAEYLAETPIPQLSDTADANIADTQPQAEFLVVMAPGGTLQVSPWVAD